MPVPASPAGAHQIRSDQIRSDQIRSWHFAPGLQRGCCLVHMFPAVRLHVSSCSKHTHTYTHSHPHTHTHLLHCAAHPLSLLCKPLHPAAHFLPGWLAGTHPPTQPACALPEAPPPHPLLPAHLRRGTAPSDPLASPWWHAARTAAPPE